MALQYSPKIVLDSLVMCLDASQNRSYPTTDLPVKNGLVMWMDASDDTTFSYSSGTTVSQWRDKSGYNYHMVPVSAGPTRNSSLNSRKTLLVTSAQQIGNLAINLQTSANTVFVVSRLTGGANGRVLTAYYNNWLLGHWGGYVNEYYAEGWIAYAVNAADTTWRMYMGDWGGSSNDTANAFSNGTSIRNAPAVDAAAGPRGLGINYQGYEQSNAEVAEIIVFNRLLSDIERKQVHTYLGQKWGIINTDKSIVDLTNNNYNGLFGNGTTANMPVFDYYNKGALKFDGTNDYASGFGSSIVPTSTAQYTVSMWVYRTRNNVGYEELLSQWTSANSGNSFYFGFNNSNVRFTDNWNDVVVSGASNTNVWMNLVGVYTTSNAFIYLNGALVATRGSGFSYTGTGPLILGRQGELTSEYFGGNISNVLIYNKALSAAEVLQNYEAQKSKFDTTIVQQGLTLNLDAGNPYSYAGSGTTWFDTSGNSYNGTLTNGPTYSTTNGGIINFDGTDDYSVSTVTSITNSSTVGIWIKSSNYAAKIPLSIASTNYGSGPNIFFSGNYINWNTGDGAGNPFTNSSYPDSNWHYIVVTNDSSTNAKLYIDGVLIGTAGYRSTLSSTSNNFWLGRFSGDNNYTINASIGVAQLYNRVLTAAEVLQNYNATKARFGL